MNRTEEQITDGLRRLADRVTPSPDAWEAVQRRIADHGPIQETEITMLTDNTTTTTRRWPLVAAAAAVAALGVAGLVLVTTGDDEIEPPADTPETPDEPIEEPVEIVEPLDLPPAGEIAEAGIYETDVLGVTMRLELVDGLTAPWTVATDDVGGLQLISDESGQEFMAFGRPGSFFDADEARDEQQRGLGSLAPDDLDGWIDANGVIVVDQADTEIGGRSVQYRQIRLDPDLGADFCPVGERPCLWFGSTSADLVEPDSVPIPLGRDRLQMIWLVDMGEFEPVIILALPNLTEVDQWLTEVVEPIIASIEFGEPAPVVPDGTARIGDIPSPSTPD